MVHHTRHARGELSLGEGKYLLEFPRVIDDLGEMHKTRRFQYAATGYPKRQLVTTYMILRHRASDKIQNATPTARQAEVILGKKKHDFVQMITDELEVDPEDMLIELAAVHSKAS